MATKGETREDRLLRRGRAFRRAAREMRCTWESAQDNVYHLKLEVKREAASPTRPPSKRQRLAAASAAAEAAQIVLQVDTSADAVQSFVERSRCAEPTFCWVSEGALSRLLGYGNRYGEAQMVEDMAPLLRSAGTQRWINGTNVYRERVGRDKQWMYWIAPTDSSGVLSEDASEQTAATTQLELVRDVLKFENQDSLAQLLEPGVRSYELDWDAQQLVQRWYSETVSDGQHQRPQSADDLLDILGVHEQDVLDINDFAEALADYLHRIERLVLRPQHRRMHGVSLGTPRYAAGATAYLSLVQKGLCEYRDMFTATTYKRTTASMLGQVDIDKWMDAQTPALHLLIDSAAGLKNGAQLERACKVVLSGGKYKTVNLPAVSLAAVEKLLVCRPEFSNGVDNPWHGKSAHPRPPMLRARADVNDSKALAPQQRDIAHALREEPSQDGRRKRRVRQDVLFRERQEEIIDEHVESFFGDKVDFPFDNEDTDSGLHGTAGEIHINPKPSAARLPLVMNGKADWNLEDARKEANVPPASSATE